MNNSEKESHNCGEEMFSEGKNPYEDIPAENKIVISELNIDDELPTCKADALSLESESDSFGSMLFSLLAKENYTDADRLCREELIRNPSSAKAHLGLLMCNYQIPTKEELAQSDEFFSENEHYLALLKSDDATLSEEIKAYADSVGERLYQAAEDIMKNATTPDGFYHAARLFEELPGFKDSAQQALYCKEKGDHAKKSAVYKKAVERLRFSEVWPPTETTAQAYEASISELKTIPDWEDAQEKLAQYQARLYDIRLTMEKRGDFSGGKPAKKKSRKNLKKTLIIISSLLILFVGILTGVLLLNTEEKTT